MAPYTSPRAVTPESADPIELHAPPTTRPSTHSRLVSPMRELERDSLPSPLDASPEDASPAVAQGDLVIVGRGRVGGSLAKAAEIAGLAVRVAGRDEPVEGAAALLLCVPDEAIVDVCTRLAGSGAS